MRLLSVSSFFLALASTFLLYSLNYNTRLLETKVAKQERRAEKLRSELAVLRAERAHLARPDRIEGLARAQGLRPLQNKQIISKISPTQRIVTGSAVR